MEVSNYEKQFNCVVSDTKSTNDNSCGIKNKSNMILQLGTKNNVTSDQTPTPTRFIRNCEEVGLFQDLLNVNPFEETFRKAAEAARAGVITPLQVSNGAGGTVLLNADDTLHTPLVFPNITETEQPGPSQNSNPTIPHSEVLDDETIKNQQSSAGILRNQLQKNGRVVRQEADTSQLRLDSTDGNNLVSQSSEITGADEFNTNTNQSPVQVLLRIPDGRLVQLSVVQVEQENETVSVIENTELKTVGGSKTVVLTTGEVIDSAKSSQPSNVISAKQKLKQALLGNTRLVTTTTTTTPIEMTPPHITTELKKIPIPRKIEYIPEKQIPRRNSSLISSEDEEEDKRRKVLERNRIAAMRCREKRKCWVAELELKAAQMGNTNQQLQNEVRLLRAEVASLKSLLLAHKDCPVTQSILEAMGTQGNRSVDNNFMASTTQIFNVTLPVTQNEVLSDTTAIQQNPPTVILLNPPNVQLKKRLQPAVEDLRLNQNRKKKICISNSIKKSSSLSESHKSKKVVKNRRLSVDLDNISSLQNERLNSPAAAATCSEIQNLVTIQNVLPNFQSSQLINNFPSKDTNLSEDININKPVATQVIQLNPNALHRGNVTLRFPENNELGEVNVNPVVTTTYR